MPVRYSPHSAVICLAIAALVFIATAGIVILAAPEDAFQYRILSVTNTAPGDFPTIRFSVVDPSRENAPYDILSDPQFQTPGVSRLAVLIGWSTRDYTNTESGNTSGAAYPISIDALANAIPNYDGTFNVTSPVAIPHFVTGSGVAAIDGHPAADVDGDGVFETQVQERNVFRNFLITGSTITARRRVVAIAKCKVCHTPHLSMHGNNRTDEPQVCPRASLKRKWRNRKH